MAHALASLFFYARFFRSFSTLGVKRCQRGEPAGADAFAGQRWLVTGATGGIGRAIALGAAQRGAQVLAMGRSPESLERLCRDAPRGRIQAVRCDLSLVRDALKVVAEIDAPIDVLVNNVGVMRHDFTRTAEGVESSFATNLLVPFAMTRQLLSEGRLATDGLVLAMSSGGLYGAKLDLDQLEATEAAAHDGFMAYAQHKRAQAALTEYWNARQAGLRAYVMHPGWVDTDGVRSALPVFRRTLGSWLRSAEEGADIALWLAAQRPDVEASIWHDRAARPLHAFGFTRGGADPQALARFLDRRIDTALETEDKAQPEPATGAQ